MIFPILKDIVWIGFIFLSLIYVLLCETKNVKKYKAEKDYKKKILFILTFFILYFCIALLHFSHKKPMEILQHDMRNIVWYCPIIFLLSYFIKDNYEVRKLFKFLLVNGIIISIFGITTKLLNKEFLLWSGDRVLSTLGNPNNLAFFLSILFFITLSKILLEKKTKIKSLLLLALFFICIIMTISLTYVLSLMLGTLLTFAIIRRSKLTMAVILIMSLSIFALFRFGFLQEIAYKYEKMMLRDSTSTSYYGRIQQVQEIKKFLKEGNSADIMFGDFDLDGYRRYDSQYWNFLRNNGLFLLCYFLIMFAYIIYVGIKKATYFVKRKENDLAAILVGCSVTFLTVVIVNLNVTAYLNRFPLNLLTYFMVGIIVLVNPFVNSKYDKKIDVRSI